MNKNIRVRFTNRITQNGQGYQLPFEGMGTYSPIDHGYHVDFRIDGKEPEQRISLTCQPQNVVLENHSLDGQPSILKFEKGLDVENYYKTMYGSIKVTTRVIRYDFALDGVRLDYQLLCIGNDSDMYSIILELEEVSANERE